MRCTGHPSATCLCWTQSNTVSMSLYLLFRPARSQTCPGGLHPRPAGPPRPEQTLPSRYNTGSHWPAPPTGEHSHACPEWYKHRAQQWLVKTLSTVLLELSILASSSAGMHCASAGAPCCKMQPCTRIGHLEAHVTKQTLAVVPSKAAGIWAQCSAALPCFGDR